MSKKIMGDLNVQGNAKSFSKNTIRDINNVTAGVDGSITYPYYEKEYIDKIMATLPISRVGTMDYLPMNINGSFEGATTFYSSRRILPVLLEDDGTMVYLRPGTNGSTDGYYYCYIPNVRNVSDLTPVLTNTKYVPTFFTPNHKLTDFVGTKASELLFMKTNNGTNDTYTIGLTNGTLNSVSHQYVEFNRTLIPNTDPQYAHIVNGLIYIWCIDSYTSTAAFDVSLYTISVDNVRNGVTTSLQRITGMSGATIYGTAVTASNTVRIASRYVSTSSADNPFLLQDAGANASLFQLNTNGVIQAVGNSANTSIRVALFHPFVINTTFAPATQYNWGLSLTFNISTKAYVLDKPSAGAITVTTTGNVVNITNPYNAAMENINGFPSDSQGNVPTIYQTSDGKVFSTVARYITSPQHKVTRATINNFTDHYTSLNLVNRTLSDVNIKYISSVYGSAVGENLINPTLISPTRIIMSCSGTDSSGNFGFDGKVYTDIGTTRNYVYNSVVSGGTINGYAPQVLRTQADNSDFKWNGLVSLIAANGSMQVYGSSFFETVTAKPAGGLLNPSTMTFGTAYTLSNTNILTNLKNSILSSVSYSGTIQDSKIVLYYVPDSTFCKSIAITSFYTNATNAPGYCVVSEIDVTIAGTVISALSASSNRISQVSSNVLGISTTYLVRMAGLVVAKYADFTYIGIPAIFNMALPGNATFRSALGKIDNTTHLITSTNMTYIQAGYVSGGASYEVGVIPNLGFGVYESGNVTDYQTKLVFKNFGTTSAQFDAMIADVSATPIQYVVMAAQDVAQGFNVYFTQRVPVFLNGRYYEMPIQSVDLNTIDASPANKTFYIYIITTETGAQYQISTSVLSDELYRVFIGTIVTGASGISSISTEKVTRFLTYRTSTTKRGSAIPASTGVPSGTGTRWH
ncbi:hypothetical protein DQT32_04945 [Salmonella enterica subsp. enterica serovar Braenderup]|nr:hypothetical protein [Salmonella enterica subsp. enterica serovar Braenderup]